MKKNFPLFVFAMLFIVGAAIPQAAFADKTSDFLKSLEGSYAGGGIARIIGDSQDKVSCRITNAFDATSNQLKMTGNCASVKGKGSVSGAITNINGGLSGTFLGSFNNAEVTKSSGKVSGSKMELSLSLVDNQTGNLTRVRQIITKTSYGLSAEVYQFDNKSGRYEKSGTLSLNKR